MLRENQERPLREGLVQKTDDCQWLVYASWEIRYNKLSPPTAQLLHMISFMHHEGIFEASSVTAGEYKSLIPLSKSQDATRIIVFRFLFSLRPQSDKWDPLPFKELTNNLRSLSLLDYDYHSGTYSMHPLIQEWCRTVVPNAAAMRECAAWLISLCFTWDFDEGSYALRRQILPHLLAIDSDHTQLAPELARRLYLIYSEAGYPTRTWCLLRSRYKAVETRSATTTTQHSVA